MRKTKKSVSLSSHPKNERNSRLVPSRKRENVYIVIVSELWMSSFNKNVPLIIPWSKSIHQVFSTSMGLFYEIERRLERGFCMHPFPSYY